MGLSERVRETIDLLAPRLENLAEGSAELVNVDEANGTVTVKLMGGRLH